MAKILTPAQVAAIQPKYGPQKHLGYESLWESLLAVCESHETLRAQLAEAQADTKALTLILKQLSEGKAQEEDPQQSLSIWDMVTKDFRASCHDALNRPGVKRVLEVRNDQS